MSLYGPRILPSVINVELICRKTQSKAVRTINNNELEIICSECNLKLTESEAMDENEKQHNYFLEQVIYELKLAVTDEIMSCGDVSGNAPVQPLDPGGHFRMVKRA